jgi:hypothetical protein
MEQIINVTKLNFIIILKNQRKIFLEDDFILIKRIIRKK